MKKITLLTMATALTVLSQATFAQSEAGRVLFTKGAVNGTIGETTTALTRGSTIYTGEKISTGDNSRAQLRYNDNTLISIDSNSEIIIKQFIMSKNNNINITKVAKGGMETISGVISKKNPSGYKIETPIATMGVRGTEFEVDAGTDPDRENTVTVAKDQVDVSRGEICDEDCINQFPSPAVRRALLNAKAILLKNNLDLYRQSGRICAQGRCISTFILKRDPERFYNKAEGNFVTLLSAFYTGPISASGTHGSPTPPGTTGGTATGADAPPSGTAPSQPLKKQDTGGTRGDARRDAGENREWGFTRRQVVDENNSAVITPDSTLIQLTDSLSPKAMLAIPDTQVTTDDAPNEQGLNESYANIGAISSSNTNVNNRAECVITQMCNPSSQ